MSGVVKSVGKVFKRIVKSPVFKIVLIAAAVYFTAGIAAGAMGSAFAVSLPGIAGAGEALGITAGAFGEAATVASAAAANAGLVTAGLGESIGLTAGEAAAASASGGAMTAAESAAAMGWAPAATEAATSTAAAAGEGLVNGATTASDAASSSLGQSAAADAGVDNGITSAAKSSTDAAANMSKAVDTAASSTPATPTTTAANASTGSPWSSTQSAKYFDALKQGGSSITDWFAKLTPSEKLVAFQGGSKAVEMGLQAYGNYSAEDIAAKNREQDKKDAIRRGGVADRSSLYAPTYHTPGIINAGVKS